MPDARIDQAIENINEQINNHYNDGNHHEPALNRGIIPPKYRINHPFANAGPRENSFGQDGAGQQNADLKTDRCDDRNEGVSERVDADDAPS